MANRDDIPRTTPAEIEHLIRQIQGDNLDQVSQDKIERLLRTVLTLVELLGRRNTSIQKLRQMIFGRRTEKHHGKKAEGKDQKSEFVPTENESTKASGDPDAQTEQNSAERTEKSYRKGHGRRATSEYSGAKKIHCRHGQLKAGDSGGLPWYRQSGLQAMAGVPLAESTMWERCEATADAALSVYLLLMRQAPAGEVMHTDDTRVRILSCLKEDEEEKGRATNTSGIVVKTGEQKIALYFSGRRHAGENLAELLKLRSDGLSRPIQMSDALAANSSVE